MVASTLRKTTCIDTRCYKCDVPMWVPVHDYNVERNYCYTCGMAKIGVLSEYITQASE